MAGDKLALKLKQGAAVCGLSARQLRELGKAYCVQLKEGEKRVHFGPTAPFDRSLPWQQTNEAGNPVGAVKYFSQGSWIEGQILANPPSEGPTGPQGVKGDKGDTGEKGDKGDTGDTGPAGADGEKGDAGPTGPQGIQGVQGPAGVTGPAGAAGTAGIDGVDGTDGTTVLAGSGAPGAGDGADEDFYVDLDFPYRLYGPKSGGVWGGGIPLNALGVPQDLSGGTALVLNSSLYDTFGANRTISAFPSLGGLTYAKITINAWVSVASVDLDFHTNNTVYEVGSGSTSALAAAVTINQGPNTLVLEYIDSRWLLTVN